MTSYKNSIVNFGFRIQRYSCIRNLSKIQSMSYPICKFLHDTFMTKWLSWKHCRTMRIATICKMISKGVEFNLKNVILISCGIVELSRKVSGGGNPPRLGRVKAVQFCALITWDTSIWSVKGDPLPYIESSAESNLFKSKSKLEINLRYRQIL